MFAIGVRNGLWAVVWFVLLFGDAGGQESAPNSVDFKSKPPTIVIVHGAWGGRHQWKNVAEQLRTQSGLDVVRASLTGLGERAHLATPMVDLDTHIQDVKRMITCEDLKPVILIGHSYGGMVVSGVANAMPDRISHLLFLDAYLPNHGENFFSQHPQLRIDWTEKAKQRGDNWLIPVDWPNAMGDVPHPLATMLQPIQLDEGKLNKIPGGYWLFTDGGSEENDKLICYFRRAKERGYSTKAFSWGHNPHRDRVDEFTMELNKFIDAIRK